MTQSISTRDMQAEDEEFVGSCTHVGGDAEWTAACHRRLPWLREQHAAGLRVKVALLEGAHAGFVYIMPIEIAPWGPAGRDLMSVQCLTVLEGAKSHGVGQALLTAAEEETRAQGRKGLTVVGHYHDFWFMPAPFFEKCGYTVARRRGTAAILWKTFDPSAAAPDFPERRYAFVPVPGKVAVDLFWSRSCLTIDTEAQRVREVTAEFGDTVVLREYCADDPQVRAAHRIHRAIFIDGQEVGWGYEAPRDQLRAKIRAAAQAMASARPGSAAPGE